jgi:hypothetical protein
VYGYGTLFENRVLRRIFGPKREKVPGEWRYLQIEELNDRYSSPNFVRVIKSRWAGHVARMGDKKGVYKVLVGKIEGMRPLGRPRCRWEDNIKKDLRKWEVAARTGSTWLRIGIGGEHL